MSKSLKLSAFGFEAEIWTKGAIVVSLVHHQDGVATPLLFTPKEPQPGATPRWFGNWAMLPMCNRAFHAKVDSGFNVLDIPVNENGLNIHGCGWQADWTLESQTENRVVLQHSEQAFGPYKFTARQSLTLKADGAYFDLTLRNDGAVALPYGMGFHPWLPANGATRVKFEAKSEIYMAQGFIPESLGPVRAMHDFSKGRAVRLQSGDGETETAANFLDWDGTAQIIWPDKGKALTLHASPNLRHPVIWSPVGAEFVCFEPQSHGVGAQTEGLVRTAAPLTSLAPGQAMQGTMSLHFADYKL